MMSELIIPCHWNWDVMRQILKNPVSKNGIPVTEIYGVLASGGPVGHGRAVSTVPFIENTEAIDFRLKLAEMGIYFTYLLNAPYNMEDNAWRRQQLDEYLKWIFDEVKPDAVMISSHDLMRYVRENYSGIKIHVSTIAGIKTRENLQKYLDIKPHRVVVHHDLGKDWKHLCEVVLAGDDYGIQVELLVTESCLLHCKNRSRHYAHLAKNPRNVGDTPFMSDCNYQKIFHPREFLLSGGAVRPEDLDLYEKMGVHHFKITGRDRDAEWLPEVVAAFQRRSYEGNFIRLLDIAPSLQAENWIYLDNKALDGFLVNYPFDDSYKAQAAYCDEWIIRLWQKGKFYAPDLEYEVQKNSLVLKDAH